MEEFENYKFNPDEMTELYKLYKSDLDYIRLFKQNANNVFLQENGGGGHGGSVAWVDVTGKPTTFTPTTGTTATTAKPGDYQPTWVQVSGKPTTFAPVAATATVVGGVKTATAPVIAITDPADDENIQAAFDSLITALKTSGVLT